MTTETEIEQEIQEKASTAPRVTPADLEADIVAEYSFTVDQAMKDAPVVESAKCLTICTLVLKNGFTVVGKSACASPANFNAELGHKIARQDAVNQIWPLLGFRLRDQLAAKSAS